MRFVYTFFILLFQLGIFLAGFFIPKARKRSHGNLHYRTLSRPGADVKVLWMHCASLGEFEQGRPILEAYKADNPHVKILLTFFSPSGFDVRKNYELATWVTYLPFDRPIHIQRFLNYFHPDVAVFVKYEFWHNFINELHKRSVPLYLASGIFRNDQVFFRPYGGFFRKSLRKFSWFFLQNKESEDLLHSIGVEKCSVSGDTRFDRVLKIVENTAEYPAVNAFCGNSKIFILGSSWPEDEKLVLPVLSELLPADWKIIIAPHELSENHLNKVADYFDSANVLRYTQMEERSDYDERIMILDTIGMLSAVYKRAQVAYVGGGFGKGIHNTLEPAAFAIPVIFGPRHKQFQEALDILACGGGFTVSKREELQVLMQLLVHNHVYRLNAGHAAGHYVQEQSGASTLILNKLKELNI